MSPPRVLLVDDFPPLRDAVRRLLSPDFAVIGEASDGEEAMELVRELQPDVVATALRNRASAWTGLQ